MESWLNGIHHGDCIAEMNRLPEGCVDLAFADPPFNIGYDYDVYHDKLESDRYLRWSHDWIAAVHRVLKPNGTFWLAIGDEYAAELKVESQKIGFTCRSWVVWYYTFGVNCTRKFTRSHAHVFHFVKDPDDFVFRADDLDNRIPSARQLVYADARANPRGRLPDDTWIIRPADAVGTITGEDETWSVEIPPRDDTRTWTLRPQDLENCFQPGEDTWYFPRVAGTFKERAGYHGCQMPEQLLGRIIRTCSEPGAVVLDPFAGSSSTAAVAKKLGRQYVAFDLSPEYVRLGQERLASICVGDRLDGSPEPLVSAPNTREGREGFAKRKVVSSKSRIGGKPPSEAEMAARASRQLNLTLEGVVAAFRHTHEGFSADRVVADPDINDRFIESCRGAGLPGDARSWNMLLFRLRKGGQLADIDSSRRTSVSWEECDPYLFASEIAWQTLLDEEVTDSLDEILCDPHLSRRFDETARRFAPGFTPFQYRWEALKLRKQAEIARSRSVVLSPPSRLGKALPLDSYDFDASPASQGVYFLNDKPNSRLYIGEALNVRERLRTQFDRPQQQVWRDVSPGLTLQVFPVETSPAQMLAWQSCFVRKYKPRLNLRDLQSRPGKS
jgi:site-specific DNA-methyltransferase (adenine-specific)